MASLDFKKVDATLRKARDCFMAETIRAINESGSTYEEAAVFRGFAESICVTFESYIIRELNAEFNSGKGGNA